MIKKIITVLLLVFSIFMLGSCGEEKEPDELNEIVRQYLRQILLWRHPDYNFMYEENIINNHNVLILYNSYNDKYFAEYFYTYKKTSNPIYYEVTIYHINSDEFNISSSDLNKFDAENKIFYTLTFIYDAAKKVTYDYY